jgi:hypothetical protein
LGIKREVEAKGGLSGEPPIADEGAALAAEGGRGTGVEVMACSGTERNGGHLPMMADLLTKERGKEAGDWRRRRQT